MPRAVRGTRETGRPRRTDEKHDYLAEVATFDIYLGQSSGAPAKGVVYVDNIRAG